MNSREFDDTLGDLFQQALRPVVGAKPPASVWYRILGDVRSVPLSRWARFLMRVRGFGGPYLPLFSNQPYCIEPHGRYQPSPFNGVMGRQVLELRLAC